MEPGVIEPGRMVDLKALKIQIGKQDNRTLRKFLKELGLTTVKYGSKEWISTTLLIRAMERDMLSAQPEGDSND